MSSNNFFPSLTSIKFQSNKDSQLANLTLYKGINNTLNVSCTIGGLSRTQRTLPYIHETLDYVAVWITLYHQFGGKETTIVRRYVREYDPQEQQDKEYDHEYLEVNIPIDDDFSGVDFINNYYYLQVSFTHKRQGEMGVTTSINNNKVFETKIPFIIKEVL
ncbi:hypothetical protein [Bacillus sp. NPDC094106]|uniref:hypothetical protein n=1 Tax=Bacillus sp. NPDC094106 TaxID=3363949 RepID=UPI003806ED61